MNKKVMRHKAICDELNSLYERKNHDYGDSFHQTFVEEGAGYDPYPVGGTSSPGLRPSPASLQMTPVSSRLRTNPFGTP